MGLQIAYFSPSLHSDGRSCEVWWGSVSQSWSSRKKEGSSRKDTCGELCERGLHLYQAGAICLHGAIYVFQELQIIYP